MFWIQKLCDLIFFLNIKNHNDNFSTLTYHDIDDSYREITFRSQSIDFIRSTVSVRNSNVICISILYYDIVVSILFGHDIVSNKYLIYNMIFIIRFDSVNFFNLRIVYMVWAFFFTYDFYRYFLMMWIYVIHHKYLNSS